MTIVDMVHKRPRNVFRDPRDIEIARLKDRIEELEGLLGLHEVVPPVGLEPQSVRLLGALLKREFISWESARIILSPNAASQNYGAVFVCKIRKWLGPDRKLLQTRWGVGAFIATKDKARVRARLAEAQR